MDGNADMRHYLSRLLGERYEVAVAADGAAALDQARERPPDVIVSDVMMPGLDGFGLLRAVRSDPSLAGVPVILLSARDGEETPLDGLDAGADDYLIKPVTARELVARVDTRLRQARLRAASDRRLRRQNERLGLLTDALAHLLANPRPDRIVGTLFPRLTASLGVDAYLHFQADTGERVLKLQSCSGLDEETVRAIERLEFGRAVCGTVAQTRQAIVAHDVQHSDDDKVTLIRSLGIQAYVCHPLLVGERLLGTLAFASRTRTAFEADEIEFFRLLTHYATLAIQRSHTEADLRESEERYRGLVNVIPAAVYTVDRNGRITFYNERAADLWGRVPGPGDEDARFCGAPRLRHPDGTPLPLESSPMVEAVRSGEGCRNREVVIERPDGTHRHVLVNVDPIRDADGSIVGAVNVFTDISERKAQEAARHRLQEELQMILDSAPTMIWYKDTDNRILRVNRLAAESIGLPKERIEGRFTEEFYPEEAEQYHRDDVAVAQTGRPRMGIVEPYRTASGKKRWVQTDKIPLKDETGRVTSILVFAQDITERKAAEEALRDSEERFRNMADGTPVIIWVTDRSGRIQFINRAYSDFFGTSVEAVRHGGWQPLVHADDAPEYVTRFFDALRDGASFHAEARVRRADGQWRWIESRGRPCIGPDGTPIGFAGSSVDITERKSAEDALRESEERLRLAMTAGEMGAWDIELATNLVTWDAKQYQLFGLSIHDGPVDVDQFYRLVHPADVASVKEAAAEASITGRFSGEFRIVLPDGGVRWIAGQGAVIKDDAGRPVRMVGVNYDITERKEAQARLERFAEELEREVAERTKEVVQSQDRLRALATELNLAEQRERKRLATELHDYLAQMLVLGRLKLGQAKQASGLPARSLDLVQQTESLLNEALVYTRTLLADLSPPVLRDFGLPAALKWLGEQMQRHELNVKVSTDGDEEFKLPEDQSVLLFQSVRELLVNAAKHAGTGEASLRLTRAGGLLRLEVSDEGMGFDPASLASPVSASSKFGLFSIRERMKALGGGFELRSASGRGTSATLTLPLDEPGVQEARDTRESSPDRPSCPNEGVRTSNAEPATPSAPLGALRRIRVLLVDDHAMVRQGLRSLLETYADVEVVGEAYDGEEAVARVDQLSPDVVVMDVNMPKLNGVEATARIRSRHSNVVVIGLSVNAGGENQEAMTKAGAAVLLTKEAAVEELYQAVRQVLTARESRRAS